MNRQVRTPWTISSWPTMTLEISDFTWLYRVRNSSARASIDSEGARDIDGDPFVTGGDVLELDNFPRPEPEYRPPPADALPCRGSQWAGENLVLHKLRFHPEFVILPPLAKGELVGVVPARPMPARVPHFPPLAKGG